MTYFAIIFVSVLLICTLFTHFLSIKQQGALKLSKVLTVSFAAGLLLSIAAYIIYYVTVLTLDNADLAEAAGNSFYVFAVPSTAFAAIIILITVGIHFLSGKLEAVRYASCHLAALLILLYTLICSSWSHYEEIDLAMYVTILGIGLALACLASPALQMRALAKNLGDHEFMKARLAKRGLKQSRIDEKIRIRETKKRLRNGTKK